jgi:hypothetical protein
VSETKQAAMADVAAISSAGRLSHAIAAHYLLERVADAHAAVEAGALIGHAVIDVAAS